MVNSIYDLKEKDADEYARDQYLPYRRFERIMYGHYELYMRSLINLLKFIDEYGKDVQKYADILLSQMTLDEYNFISWHLKTDKTLSGLMDKVGIRDKQL